MTITHDSLIADVPRLSDDEAEFMRFVMDRVLIQGRASYAPWVAATDKRDIDKEIADECADAVVYTGMRAVLRARKRSRIARFNSAHCQGGETVAATGFEIRLPNNGSTEGDAYTPSVSVGRAGSNPAPDTIAIPDRPAATSPPPRRGWCLGGGAGGEAGPRFGRRVESHFAHLPEVPGERERLSPTPREPLAGFTCDFSNHASGCDVWSVEGCSGEPGCQPAITRAPAVDIGGEGDS